MDKERLLKGAIKLAIPVGLAIVGSVFAFSPATKQEIKDRQRGRCADCGKEGPLHVHHIVPMSVGGSDEFINGTALCPNDHLYWDNEVMLKGVIYPGKPIEKAWPAQVSNWKKFRQGVAQIRQRAPLPKQQSW